MSRYIDNQARQEWHSGNVRWNPESLAGLCGQKHVLRTVPMIAQPGPAPLSAWGFSLADRVGLDDVSSPMHANGFMHLVGFGVMESPDRCGSQSRKRIPRKGGYRSTFLCALRPWLREADAGRNSVSIAGLASCTLNPSPRSSLMEYRIGMKLRWLPLSKHQGEELVTVDSLRRRGAAKLSNGWVVDADGISEGTGRIPGGSVAEVPA